jgi:GT2 family glycosyltransferase
LEGELLSEEAQFNLDVDNYDCRFNFMRQIEMRVSVLLSTCNRCDKLRSLLDTLKTSGMAGMTETEVLVIDNGSTDATKQVVAEYTSLENPIFRYLFEGKPGKSRALNAGIREAKGEILAVTDDDCIPGPGWVQNILREFDSDPELSVLGGRVELYDEKDLPQTILLLNYPILVKSVRQVFEPTVIGANMAFRKTVLTATHGYDPLLGPGSICKAAEDIDLVYRSLRKGFKIAYSPEVIIFHNHGRRTKLEEDKTSFAYAFGRGALYAKHILRFDFRIVPIAFRELYGLTKTLTKGVITRTRFPYHQLALPAIVSGAFYYCQARFSWRRFPKAPMPNRTLAH